MQCPECGAAANPDELGRGDPGSLRCQWCDHTWRPTDAQLEALAQHWVDNAPADSAQLDTDRTPPRGVEERDAGGGITLRIPWLPNNGIGTHLTFVAIIALFVGFAMLQAVSGTIPVLPLIVAFALLLSYIFVVLNATTLRIRPDGVTVTHGPLPSFLDSDVQLDPADLSRLQVREIVSTVRFRVYRHYTLTAGSTVLMRKFTDEARVAYAARRIADIVDRPVEVVRL